jgi:hypothetical protein
MNKAICIIHLYLYLYPYQSPPITAFTFLSQGKWTKNTPQYRTLFLTPDSPPTRQIQKSRLKRDSNNRSSKITHWLSHSQKSRKEQNYKVFPYSLFWTGGPAQRSGRETCINIAISCQISHNTKKKKKNNKKNNKKTHTHTHTQGKKNRLGHKNARVCVREIVGIREDNKTLGVCTMREIVREEIGHKTICKK